MLRANRARNWGEFRKAFDGFAIPGQRMLYADCAGHIGELMAACILQRGLPSLDLTMEADRASDLAAVIGSTDLPWTFDPPPGFIASANERPSETDLLIGHHWLRAQWLSRNPGARIALTL
jgi:penicillin amidase